MYLPSVLNVINCSERTRDGAYLATNAGGFVDHFGARGFVHGDGFHRAGMQAPGFVALGAGVGHFFASVVEVKHLDAGFGGGVCAVVLERTGHFALQTTSAFICVDMQRLLHAVLH